MVQVLWNKVLPDGGRVLRKANSWSYRNRHSPSGGFLHPGRLFSDPFEVYGDMKGRKFQHPIIHKPPWNYVTYDGEDETGLQSETVRAPRHPQGCCAFFSCLLTLYLKLPDGLWRRTAGGTRPCSRSWRRP